MHDETQTSNLNPSEPVAAQVERQLEGARLRTLIVGAGIAGATLAALMRQRGEPAAIIERGKPDDSAGYMLGLLPLGGRVLNGLGLRDAYHDVSVPMQHYVLYNRNGELIRDYPLAPLVDRFGIWGGVMRGELLSLLRGKAGDVLYDTTPNHIDQSGETARVTFQDGSSTEVDLVVGADGIHSHTRSMILADSEVEKFETGWGVYIFYAPLAGHEADTYRELWSGGWGVGLYPVAGRLAILVGGRMADIADKNPQDLADMIGKKRLPELFRRALQARDRNETPYLWKMADTRAKVWWRGRTVLLGDAAAAFLPTAGVGASAAMDSAAALSDELSRADAAHLPYALSLYEKRQRHRAELAQKNSRDLARFMFVNNPLVALGRDQLMRFYSLKQLVADISRVMEGV